VAAAIRTAALSAEFSSWLVGRSSLRSGGCAVKWLIQVAEGVGAIVALLVAAILWFAQSSIESLIEVKRAGKGKQS
jgi:hypothetical protein